ncbi:MAG: CinA family protein [Alphaproteobacteria bacterium]
MNNYSLNLLSKITKINEDLIIKKLKIVTAESCTGGLLSGLFTEISGSSKIFDRGFVVYSNQSKIDILAVDENLILNNGAVSFKVCEAMLAGALQNSQANLAIAITGIAGPQGDTINKKVGNVFIGVRNKENQEIFEFNFSGNRQQIRNLSLENALEILQNFIKNIIK